MRKVYIIPNIVTTANMAAGFYSVIAAIHNEFTVAAWAILVAAVFDMLDGRIARLAKATSQFGVEYDSLSDVLSFGMAPAILLYQWTLNPFGRMGWLAAFLYLACAGLRLARFNVTTSVLSKKYFQGLPTPIAAGMVATSVIFKAATDWPTNLNNWVLGLTLGLASLMVSNIPFPSFKELNWRARASFGYLMVGVMTMILIAARPEIALFFIGVIYILGSILYSVYQQTVTKNRTVQQCLDL
jgi:CDP-diacylglycerol--serine O-phosphatidyltransferase